MGPHPTLAVAYLRQAIGMTERNLGGWLRTFCRPQVPWGAPVLIWRLAELRMPADNNQAERQIRHSAVTGTKTYGSRPKPGAQARAVLVSVFPSCQPRDIDRSHHTPARVYGGSHSIPIAHSGSRFTRVTPGSLGSYLFGAAAKPIPINTNLRKQGCKGKISRTD